SQCCVFKAAQVIPQHDELTARPAQSWAARVTRRLAKRRRCAPPAVRHFARLSWTLSRIAPTDFHAVRRLRRNWRNRIYVVREWIAWIVVPTPYKARCVENAPALPKVARSSVHDQMSKDLIFSFVEMVQRGSRSEFGDPDKSRKIVTKDRVLQ